MPVSQITNHRVVLASRPKGVPEAEHFRVDEAKVDGPGEGQLLIENHYWSIDPAMRGWSNDAPNYLPPVEIGAPMRSFAVGKVLESQDPRYSQGDRVSGMFNWQSHAVCDADVVDRKIEQTDLPPSLALGILGLNGVTAYFGLLDICDPQQGETVVVSTAAGAVGSVVGQIAKIRGCRTVGITSTQEKADQCLSDFGYDAAIRYRDEDVAEAIRRTCSDGVNCYFDNTCGAISDAVMTHLALGARITICGTASLTDWNPIPEGPRIHRQMIVARARMQGFLVLDYKDRYGEAIEQLAEWVREGKLSYREHILDGIEQAPGSIAMLYRGENTGKLLVRVKPDG